MLSDGCLLQLLWPYSHIELQRLNAEMQALEATYAHTQEQLFQQLCDKVRDAQDIT